MARKHHTLWLAFQLVRLHWAGWRQVPGYTVAENRDGEIYVAVSLAKAEGR
ncbi:hypothetical protein [Devosia sp. Root105]|uniref:hypothetical protein n=1 Tax=Devosia sp. Root105 TaxID=1736423 RepID=UPI000A764A40|nr:hypothetical protein [Devosia sp. Root105]